MNAAFLKIITDPIIILTTLFFMAILVVIGVTFIIKYKPKLDPLKINPIYFNIFLLLLGSVNLPFLIFWHEDSIINLISLVGCYYFTLESIDLTIKIKQLIGE